MTAITSPEPKRAWRAAATALALLGPLAPAAASAATLFSPPVSEIGGSFIECAILNVSATALSVTIRPIDDNKALASTTVTVAAKATRNQTVECAGGVCQTPRCEFVTSSPASSFRASACVREVTGLTIQSKNCLEAR